MSDKINSAWMDAHSDDFVGALGLKRCQGDDGLKA
jgi:hypothetical protein